MSLETMTVTGTWVMEDGTPATGRIEFKPNAVRFINNGLIVVANAYEFELDDQGMLNGATGVELARYAALPVRSFNGFLHAPQFHFFFTPNSRIFHLMRTPYRRRNPIAKVRQTDEGEAWRKPRRR